MQDSVIGIVLVTHSSLGEALIEASEFVLGSRPESVTAISIDLNEKAERLRTKIAEGIKSVDQRRGVLIMTDMFGGTPSNLSYSFLEEGRIEVISGVNLPILIKAVNSRGKSHLSDSVINSGSVREKKHSLASGILRGNKRE